MHSFYSRVLREGRKAIRGLRQEKVEMVISGFTKHSDSARVFLFRLSHCVLGEGVVVCFILETSSVQLRMCILN